MNFLILLYLVIISPKILLDRVRKGKKHPGFLQRIGLKIPPPSTIWIHAVSVGEVKAAKPLLQLLKMHYPHYTFLITTTSATGQEEARRSLPEADHFAYLPLDLSFVVKRWVRKVNPQLFLLIESDIWPNLLKALKQNSTKILLVSGKLSPKSARRFSLFPHFSKRLFARFDALCVQNGEHHHRFTPFTSNLHITGNLKLDLKAQPTQPLSFPKPCLILSCTHPHEEELLLDALEGPWHILLAPRHPERFQEVAQLLQRKKIPYSLWSNPAPTKVLLIDAMGQLPSCYAHADLAILGGSYVPHIGGHNPLEPLLYSTPLFFGPHTQAQQELTTLALASGAARCIPLENLRAAVTHFFSHPQEADVMRTAAKKLIEKTGGAAQNTLAVIKSVWE
jgi:3-deoxy-D-manno-octulosonic-acid transferase